MDKETLRLIVHTRSVIARAGSLACAWRRMASEAQTAIAGAKHRLGRLRFPDPITRIDRDYDNLA